MKHNLSEPNRYSVVIADDGVVMRRILVRALEATRCFTVVAEAADGDAALDAVRAHRPDLLILDLSMPGKGGLESLEEIRETSPGTFVAVFSGLGPDILGRPVTEAGAHLHLEKTVPVRDFVDELLAGIAVHEARLFAASAAGAR